MGVGTTKDKSQVEEATTMMNCFNRVALVESVCDESVVSFQLLFWDDSFHARIDYKVGGDE